MATGACLGVLLFLTGFFGGGFLAGFFSDEPDVIRQAALFLRGFAPD